MGKRRVAKAMKVLDKLYKAWPDDGKLCWLYSNYCEELDQYDPQAGFYPEGQAQKVYKQYADDKRVKIKPIKRESLMIGFLMTMGTDSGKSLIILEAYIIPKYRRQGYMRKAMEEEIKPGITCIGFMVFDTNPAIQFWEKMMEEFNFTKVHEGRVARGITEYAYLQR